MKICIRIALTWILDSSIANLLASSTLRWIPGYGFLWNSLSSSTLWMWLNLVRSLLWERDWLFSFKCGLLSSDGGLLTSTKWGKKIAVSYHLSIYIIPRFKRKQIFTQQKLYEIHLTDNCIRELVSRTPLLSLNEQFVSIIFTRFVNVCKAHKGIIFRRFPRSWYRAKSQGFNEI